MTITVKVGDDIGFEFNNCKIHKISFDNYREVLELINEVDIAREELNLSKGELDENE